MNKLFLVDAYALIFKFYYAFVNRPMRNKEGLNTSAIFGFTKFINDIITREHPRYLGVAFDPKGGNFRHKLYPDYKANRSATPEDIVASIPHIKRILDAMHIPVLEVAGYEADDVIGTLSAKGACQDFEIYMVTPDKDYGQLIRPCVYMYKPSRSGEGVEVMGVKEITEHYGIDDPLKIIDILALWGDASDNVPGVPGIGEKTAVKLINEWGSVENIIANADKLSGKQRDNVIEHTDRLRLAKQLVTIDLNVPIEFEPEKLHIDSPDYDALKGIYIEMGFNMFLKDLDFWYRAEQKEHMTNANTATGAWEVVQGDLFAPAVTPSGRKAPADGAARTAPTTTGNPTQNSGTSPFSTATSSLLNFNDRAMDAAATVQPTLGQQQPSQPASREQPSAEQGTGQGSGASQSVDSPFADSVAQNTQPYPTTTPQFDLFSPTETPLYQTIETTAHTYTVVETPEAINQLVGLLLMSKEVCFDTETTSLDPLTTELVGLSFSVEPHKAYYVPCIPYDRTRTTALLERFRPVFQSESIAKIGQNIKFDILVLQGYGMPVNGFLYDTMIIHYLLNSEARHGMDYLARTLLNYSPVPIENLIGKGSKQLTMDRIPVEIVSAYAAEDADITLQLKQRLWPELEQEPTLVELYKRIEEPLIGVLAGMEAVGVNIDKATLDAYATELNTQMRELEERIKTLAGEPTLNVNSAKQLGEVLFEKLKVTDKPKKTKTKQYSTDEEYLVSLSHRHEIIAVILEYRGIKKLLSTYVEALPLLINPKTGRIHTNYNQAVASTGRLSSNNPNLQNIPIREAQGRKIRQAFVPGSPNSVILSVDYSQVELRIMAHLSGDKALIEAFAEGQDVHTSTAAKIFGIAPEEVTQEQRRRAKTANFGIIYGISVFGLSQRLDIPREESKALIDGYFASYPQVKAYMDQTIAEARERGYVTTMYGRRRTLTDIRSTNATVRGLAERNAINAPIQGSAADIIKLAMAEVAKRLKSESLTTKLILQVHDELVLEVPQSELEQVKKLVVDTMESVCLMDVKLIAEAGTGKNWLEAH